MDESRETWPRMVNSQKNYGESTIKKSPSSVDLQHQDQLHVHMIAWVAFGCFHVLSPSLPETTKAVRIGTNPI